MKEKVLTLLFLVKDQDILLAMKKRGFGAGRWNGVGGKVEPGEKLEEALERECQEEIGVTPLNYEKVAEITFSEVHEGERKLMHVNAYLCQKWDGKPTESEEMRPKWFRQSQIPYKKMWPDDEYWLGLVLDGNKIQAKFTLGDDDHVVSHKIKQVQGFS